MSMKASRSIFGQNGFRLWVMDRKRNGQWARNVNASIFQCISVSFADHDLSKLTRCSDAILEEYLDLVTTDQVWIDGVSKSTGDFYKIKYVFETWNTRLSKLLESVDGLDRERTFSIRLKKEMFLQDKTCRLCGQEIKLLQDAALDHDIHYWRGGKTIPSNARLVHRLCNLNRPK
jgi:HNH endonuclease